MRTSIYLPDALAEQIKQYEISISEVAQAAFQVAVERAQLQEKVMSDIAAVAARLQGGITKIMQMQYATGRDAGIAWAKRNASIEELRAITDKYWSDHSNIIDLIAEAYSPGSSVDYEDDVSEEEKTAMYDAFEQGFVQGAGEVWEAVKPLLEW
ncbi:hypothetical protein FDA94_05910 [Herbidospora galbida]|uniref:Uncharacterized protein n=1 Tax=Herbidospora galbida TaxID=2575442 RepID=A0A4U3MQZ1_9ACTN|nr:hypothetical protein [Herbidospora galbida]TKK90526.1 hypothetical protein FDA94_05910 [Herbidospora galbida]